VPGRGCQGEGARQKKVPGTEFLDKFLSKNGGQTSFVLAEAGPRKGARQKVPCQKVPGRGCHARRCQGEGAGQKVPCQAEGARPKKGARQKVPCKKKVPGTEFLDKFLSKNGGQTSFVLAETGPRVPGKKRCQAPNFWINFYRKVGVRPRLF
jgi:hypothetical protein